MREKDEAICLDDHSIRIGNEARRGGKELAELLIKDARITVEETIELNVTDTDAGLLIRAFFEEFYAVINALPTRARIRWCVQYDFQRKNIERWLEEMNSTNA